MTCQSSLTGVIHLFLPSCPFPNPHHPAVKCFILLFAQSPWALATTVGTLFLYSPGNSLTMCWLRLSLSSSLVRVQSNTSENTLQTRRLKEAQVFNYNKKIYSHHYHIHIMEYYLANRSHWWYVPHGWTLKTLGSLKKVRLKRPHIAWVHLNDMSRICIFKKIHFAWDYQGRRQITEIDC